MANPTTNFGWVMPTSSSLVTNLPADFNTFGQAVDTSMSELLGGTTGQVLSKTSNTNMDFTWVTPQTGDITGVTAGTGISGGGTSGDVTVTNSMATAMTTKGDLVPATGSGAFARLGVGANNTVLTADSAAATGMKWATPSSTPTFVGCSLYKSSNQAAANGTSTAVTFEAELFDTNGFHDNSTNNTRITIPSGYAGKYIITGVIQWASSSSGNRVNDFKLNGSTFLGYSYMDANGYQSCAVTMIQDLAVGDYVEMIGYQNSGGSLGMGGGGRGESYFAVTYLGA